MQYNNESQEGSVLDEIRSTIASLDAIRGRATSSFVSAPATPHVDVADEPAETTHDQSEAWKIAESVYEYASGEDYESRGVDAEKATKLATDGYDSEAEDDISGRKVLSRQVNTTAKIMIVDDEPLNIMTFRQHLKLEGYHRFVSTTDANEALSMAKRELPDVMLLDVDMPRITGLDILRVMALDPVLQHIPVLILTAATDPAIRKSALELGASDFLAKPIDPNELLPRVRNATILKIHYDMMANQAARLEQQVERRTRQLESTRQQLIQSLARAAEHRSTASRPAIFSISDSFPIDDRFMLLLLLLSIVCRRDRSLCFPFHRSFDPYTLFVN